MRLLYIAHRIPYPPNKGDKIRSYNELLFLSRRYEVDLVCFYGTAEEREHLKALEGMCRSVSGFRRTLWGQPLRLLAGLLLGEPASVSLYRSRGIRQRIESLLAGHDYRHIMIFSGQMVQYVPGRLLGRTVVDLCDVDSYKWENYAERMPFYLAWFYRLEARRLLAFEKAASLAARATILITPTELDLYRSLGGSGNLKSVGNGVDTEYFRPPDGGFEEGRILFTGAMDYFPNEDGVSWFARDVFPALREAFPRARFVIAGSNPSGKVQALGRIDGVDVTGYVQDMRTEQARAHVVVVPLRIARGMQNKVLEAMACGRAVVVHPKALGGIDARDGRDLFIAESAEDFRRCVATLLGDPEAARAMGQAAREYILATFSWERSLAAGLLPLLEDGPSRLSSSAIPGR